MREQLVICIAGNGDCYKAVNVNRRWIWWPSVYSHKKDFSVLKGLRNDKELFSGVPVTMEQLRKLPKTEAVRALAMKITLTQGLTCK